MWRNLPIAAFALFAPSLAAADADGDVLTKAKLVGHWAQDCAKAPAMENAISSMWRRRTGRRRGSS